MKGSEPPRIKVKPKSTNTMKIYILRYCHKGYADEIRLFNTLKAAQTAAKTTIDWGAWRATIYATTQQARNTI